MVPRRGERSGKRASTGEVQAMDSTGKRGGRESYTSAWKMHTRLCIRPCQISDAALESLGFDACGTYPHNNLRLLVQGQVNCRERGSTHKGSLHPKFGTIAW